MEINWEVNDGYVGKGRPQMTEIDEDFILNYCDNVEDALDFVEGEVQEEFESRINWDYLDDLAVIKQKLELLFKDKKNG